MGTETTLAEDISDYAAISTLLYQLVCRVATLLADKQTGGRTLTLKVGYSDFTTITRSCTTREGFFAAGDIMAQLPRLLAATEAGRRKIRLLGLTVANLCSEDEARRIRVSPVTPALPADCEENRSCQWI